MIEFDPISERDEDLIDTPKDKHQPTAEDNIGTVNDNLQDSLRPDERILLINIINAKDEEIRFFKEQQRLVIDQHEFEKHE